MRKLRVSGASSASLALPAVSLALVFWAGCGLVYQASSGYRAHKMSEELKAGQTMPEVRDKWGEPDLHTYPDSRTEVWSYAIHANTNDVTAMLLYTSTKEGDTGSFLDLRFTGGKLVSWGQARHTMPPKEGPGFSAGLANPGFYPDTAHY